MKTVVFFGHSPYRKMGLDVSGRCLPNHTRVSDLSKNTLGYVCDARETLWHALVRTSYSHLVWFPIGAVPKKDNGFYTIKKSIAIYNYIL